MTAKEELEPRRALIAGAADGLPPGLELEYRAMFGGIGIFTRGRMCAIISSTSEVALKLDEADRAELLQMEGAHAWSISSQYIVLPEALLTEEALRPWLAQSAAYAQTLPLPKKKTRKRR